MRTSISLTSIFSSFRSPMSSHFIIPSIQIISPMDPVSPRLSAGINGGIRRWRGALGTLGDLTLQPPSQGLTSGARLALARQGCATGSFRLNCSESLYALDCRGLAMFQSIELDEELDKATLGFRERPPMLADTMRTTESLSARAEYRPTRRTSLRSQKRNALAVHSLHFESGGLSSCATFTAGLCNLEDYIRQGEVDSVLSGISTSCSAQEIGQTATSGDMLHLSWFDSVKRLKFSSGTVEDAAKVKKKRSAGKLIRSFTCVNFDMSFSEAPSADTDAILPTIGSIYDIPAIILEDDDAPAVPILHKLIRVGSWARLRRKISGKMSTKQTESSNDVRALDHSVSLASGLFQTLQHGMPVACVHPAI